MGLCLLQANNIEIILNNPVEHPILDRGPHSVDVVGRNFHLPRRPSLSNAPLIFHKLHQMQSVLMVCEDALHFELNSALLRILCTLTKKQWFQMTIEKIVSHVSRNKLFVLVKHVQVLVTFEGGDLVADVQQLTH